jgi:hypothetical protein
LKDVLLVDPSASEIPKANYDNVPATYQYSAPLPPSPWLQVSSKSWTNKAADAAGRVFNITITINDLVADWHVVGIQWWLEFDTTLLETKQEWIFEGPFAKQFGDTFFVAYVDKNVIAGQLQLPPWPGPSGWMSGSGVLATVQFNAKYKPPPSASCDLKLTNVLLVDNEANVVPYSRLENGKYEITPAEPPWLSVTPKTVEVEKKGDAFNLNVVMNEIDKGFRLVGTEFKIRYNTTLLEVKNITEGDFMKDFATHAGTDTFFQTYVEEDYGLIGIIILPLPDGTGWPEEVFPEGTGTLARITFASAREHDKTQDITTICRVNDVLLVDVDAKEIAVNLEKTAAEGTCTVTLLKSFVAPGLPQPPKPWGPDYPPYSIDLHTQYPEPYGGQGYQIPSDAFGPQSEVLLQADVTYYGEPVAGKPVSFIIRGPAGQDYSAVIMTDSNGVATLRYILPWSEDSFGLWEAAASGQIGAKTVTDTMMFRVGYLFKPSKVTLKSRESNQTGEFNQTDPSNGKLYPVYYKGKLYAVSMNIGSICMQGATVWPTVTIIDELGQPVGYVATLKDIASMPVITENKDEIKDFVQNQRTRTITLNGLSIKIGSNAFSGRAQVQSVVLSLFDRIAYSTPTIDYIWIRAEAIPPPKPATASLEVLSPVQANRGGTFNVKINIKDVNPDDHIVAIQFKLKFDTSILKTAESNVVEGDFVKQFGDTYMQVYVDNNVLVGILQLPPWPGSNGWMRGSGTLCTITFQVIGVWGGTYLNLADAFMVNSEGNTVNFKSLKNASVLIA